MATCKLDVIDGGGVTSAAGFAAAGIHAGFRQNPNRYDLALVVADDVCPVAGVFTQNVFCAAPVKRNRRVLSHHPGNPAEAYGCVKAVIVNSGIANAATGKAGDEAAQAEGDMVSQALGCAPDEVLVCSTGVIGVQLPTEPFETGIPAAVSLLSRDSGADAASAIMTTDTHPKEFAVSFSGAGLGYEGCTFTVGGMAKGSGMITPNMATMIAVLTTDAPVEPDVLWEACKQAADVSFNKVTVDSDTSTNDTCILMASGAAAPEAAPFAKGSPALAAFQEALTHVCIQLAKMMARDGEGSTRLVNVNVTGAASAEDADLAARAIANSPLVKTAIAGRDANWGRIAAAAGKSGAAFAQEDVDIQIMGIPVCAGGLALDFDEDEALRRFEEVEIDIDVDLGAGPFATTVWTCDLTHDYVSINADYRS